MITEREARDLLGRAAGTIEVPPGEPTALIPPQRPRWVAPLVAAAAIAAAVATGLAVVHDDTQHDQPGPVGPTPSPTVDPFAGSVPPVFAYDGDSAQKMLEDRGLRVQRKVVTNKCEVPDRALRTRPQVGFPVEPGDTVTLYVSGGLVAFCNPPEFLAWSILDFANGRGPEPPLAADAKFYVNGKSTTGAKASAALAALTRRGQADLFLHVQHRKVPRPCWNDEGSVPTQYVGRSSYLITIDAPTDGVFGCPPAVYVFRNGNREIDGIVIEAAPFLVDPPKSTQTPPADRAPRQPAGHFINFAKGWMQRPGFAESFRLYNDGSYVATLDPRRAMDRSSFNLCPGSAHPAQCGLSPIQLIGQLRTAPTISTRADCFKRAGILPHVSGQATVLITDPGVPPCKSSWVVQLDFNDEYKIVAVNEFEGAE